VLEYFAFVDNGLQIGLLLHSFEQHVQFILL
jgi:hypothetical protein